MVKVTAWHFLSQFNAIKKIVMDCIDYIDGGGESISSIEMDDCITLFALERGVVFDKGRNYSRLIGYHISSLTDFADMKQKFADMTIKDNLYYDIYLIGGNAASTAPGDLLDVILEAIPKIFSKSFIKEKYLSLKPDKQYIIDNMDINGVLTFCKHGRLC